MKGDAFNFQRGRDVALLGLGIQTLVTVVLVIYIGFAGRDHAAVTAAAYSGFGIPVWLTLVLLFDFHRRERIEAAESERLAADPAGSAFDDTGAELLVAARRLAGIRRGLVPIVSLSVAASLIVVGLVRLLQVQAAGLTDPDNFVETNHPGWAVAIGVGVGFIGFVFARFISGMAKQPVWGPLRAGASWAVGTAAFVLIIALGHLARFEESAILRLLQAAYPVALIVLGGEIVLNFLSGLYLPRVPGEEPRAAFDSRLLGLLAAPDRIAASIGEALNYQFGVRVTETWFYQLLQRWWPAFAGLAVGVVWLLTAIVVVEPHQRAIILTNGRVTNPDAGPGLHLKYPWPLGRVYIPQYAERELGPDGSVVRRVVSQTATGVRQINLGTTSPAPDTPVLWTNDHGRVEVFNIVQPASVANEIAALATDAEDEERAGDASAEPGTPGGIDGRVADVSLVAVELPMRWAVGDLLAYDTIAIPEDRDRLVEVLGQRAATLAFGDEPIDRILGGDRPEIAAELARTLETDFARVSRTMYAAVTGQEPESESFSAVEVLGLGTGNTHPPRDTAEAFEEIIQTRQTVEATILEAESEKIRVLSEAAGSVELAEPIIETLAEYDALRDRAGEPDAPADLDGRLAELQLELRALIADAGGEAGAILVSAEAQRWQLHMGERGRAARFGGELAAFNAAPAVFTAARYFDASVDAVRDSRIFWVGAGASDALTVIDLNSSRAVEFDPEIGSDLQ